MRSYAAGEVEIFRRVRIPNTLPILVSALKVASLLAMIGAVDAEYYGGTQEELGVQIIGISADNPFAQKTFAESLNLPFPLLSDFPDRKVIQTYGILGASQMTANRSFFLVDDKGILRQQWLLGAAGGNTVMPSEPILKAVQEIKGKP